jgi:hypothetical protein
LLRLNSASSFVTFFESNDKLHVLRDVRIESKSPDKIEKVIAEDCFPAILLRNVAGQPSTKSLTVLQNIFLFLENKSCFRSSVS